MGARELETISTAIREALVADPLWQGARGIAAFVGVRNEVETEALIDRCLAAGKAVWLPRVLGGGVMRFWPLAGLAALEPGRMGLREPPSIGPGEAMPGRAAGVDLVLVPGLGFGRDGARLGFGAGHYDRALAQRAPGDEVPLVGVAPEAFMLESGEVAVEAHDVAMTHLLSERGLVSVDGTTGG